VRSGFIISRRGESESAAAAAAAAAAASAAASHSKTVTVPKTRHYLPFLTFHFLKSRTEIALSRQRVPYSKTVTEPRYLPLSYITLPLVPQIRR
jgi:hypothetical protein